MGVLLAKKPDPDSPKDIVERLVEKFGEETVRSVLPKGRGGRPRGSTAYKDLRALLFFTEARMTGEASRDREAGRMFAHLTDGNSTDAIVDRLRTKYRKHRKELHSYPYAVRQHLGHRVDYAQLIKEYGTETEAERRYSPPKIIGTEKRYIIRFPDPDRICSSHVERLNLDVRMSCRRFTRLTNAFSRKLRNHRAAVAVFAAVHNFVKMHRSISMTPAMKAGLTNRVWRVGDLLAA